MRFKDNCRLETIGGMKFPKLKGHVKITLHNCRTGKNEVVEGENIVTNAMRDILAANYAGGIGYNNIFGNEGLWKKFFGGVLLYEQAHTLDPDNYYPRADSVNHLFAHAGPNPIDPEHDDDLTRGTPLSIAFVQTENSVKQVWEWGSIRGNVPDGRYIRSLSLTHADVGDAGLGSGSYAFSQLNPLEPISAFASNERISGKEVYAQYNEAHGVAFAIGNDGEWTYGHQAFETNKITVYKRKFPFLKTGLYQTQVSDGRFEEKFTITISFNVYAQPCFYFDQVNKRLWLFTNYTSASTYSKSVIKYSVIDCENQTEYAHGTITSDTENIAPLGYGDNSTYYNAGRSVFMGIAFDGTYFYFPTGINNGAGDVKERLTGYQKINYSNQADQTTISLNSGEITKFWSPMCSGGLLVSDGGVVNGDKLYPCQSNWGLPFSSGYSVFAEQPNKPSSYFTQLDTLRLTSASAICPRGIFANKFLNMTLFNLPSPIQKTSSQSMTVEYTLQEVTGGDES